ncbi:MAG: hypothetical protein ABR568_15165 [Pyrinomonadaceae bacterium]
MNSRDRLPRKPFPQGKLYKYDVSGITARLIGICVDRVSGQATILGKSRVLDEKQRGSNAVTGQMRS